MSASARLVCLPPDKNESVWPNIESYVRKSTDRTGGDFAEIEKAVVEGVALVWLIKSDRIDGIVITEIATQGSVKKLFILSCAAITPMAGWIHLLDELEQFGRNEGCATVKIPNSRPGWKRRLNGYREPYVTLEKDL